LPIHADADNNDRAMIIAESIASPLDEVHKDGVGRWSARGEVAETHTAVEKFLLSTLVGKLALRARAGARYATLRSWRNPIREFQIDALQALKSQMPTSFVDVVASEIVDAVRLLHGGEVFDAVVPVPSSRGRLGNGFSERIARAVARKTNSEFIAALAIAPTTGNSHPRKNAKRPAMRRLADLASKIVLIVDDVATSGSHIEEATRLVRESARSSFAIAWIGGNAEK
jgi:phosphoribosylpyrophosphate synthetase